MTWMTQGPLLLLRTAVLALCTALSLSACGDGPKQDDFKSQGGISPDPTGIIAGSVLYNGPRPRCEYQHGKPSRIIGRVVFYLFEYTNPPPPEGRATTAINIMFRNPEGLFTLSDCLPEGKVYDPSDPSEELITRSVDYSWVQIKLEKTAMDYQIKGFYDTDEDMNPFFSVRKLPTQGDIAGAALEDVQHAEDSPFLHVVMPAASDEVAQNGYRVQGVIVALGNYVWLENPASKLNELRFMDATRTVVPRQVAGSSTIDIEATVNEAWANTCNGRLGCGLEIEQATEEEFGEAFETGGIDIDYDPATFAYVSEPIDVVTIEQDAPDVTRPDGIPDPHPLLGANLGVPWYSPMFIMSRLAPNADMQKIETATGIPPVRMIGSVLFKNGATPEDPPLPEKRVRLGSVEVAVPAIAAVELDPTNTQCRLPYLAPGNLTRAFESRLTYCSDLPTGVYSLNVLQGLVGGERVEADSDVSDTGYVYNNGRPSGQAWTIPNELGDEEQVGDAALESQAPGTAFVLYDRNLDGQGDCRVAQDPDNNLVVRPVNYRGICEDGESFRIENPAGAVGAGIDGPGCLPAVCCEAVSHLCGVPLCEPCDEESCPGLNLGGNHPIRQGPTKIVSTTKNGKSVPNCVPFPLPTLCCPDQE
jgi:hypothetical protein